MRHEENWEKAWLNGTQKARPNRPRWKIIRQRRLGHRADGEQKRTRKQAVMPPL